MPIATIHIYYIKYPTIIFCEVTPNKPSTTRINGTTQHG
uniref:Uncharacterized protein n=1 Tax=Podoviridae sp. ctdDI2 TaxID=2826567 RepID=A0A8S5NRU8_9CAUD|nr:MAG TPA: hypothetical protein [Podoviridae sp. ctdDI2]